MNGFYEVILILIIFGAATGFVNEFNVFGTPVPVGGTNLDESAVTAYGEGMSSQSSDGSGLFGGVLAFLRIVWSVAVSVFAVGLIVKDYLIALGADTALAWAIGGVIQAPASFVVLGGIFEWFTGRNLT